MPELDPYFATQTTLPLSVIIMRLMIAMLCGAAIGFERERKNTAAGLRTHILVCLSSAIVAILTIEIAHHEAFQGEAARVDPLRLIEAITAGVAFLAAGMIVFSKGEVRGLTTGAGLWFSGSIGLAAGLGFWHVSLVATLLALVVLWLLQGIGPHIAPDDAEWCSFLLMTNSTPVEKTRRGVISAAGSGRRRSRSACR